MKHITSLTLIALVAILISSCGAQPVPTVNSADVQHTAEAAAFTMVAQTQAAMPTATPLPPTEIPTNTPAPTDTPAAVPTLDTTVATVGAGVPTLAPTNVPASGNATVDPCSNRVLAASPKGQSTIIRIANLTKAAVNVSLYLEETAGAGECGYRGYTLTKLSDVVITDLVQGCYDLWAWSQDGQKVHVNAYGYGCLNNSDKWTFEINEGSIKFTQ
jgi:hypothetical protein